MMATIFVLLMIFSPDDYRGGGWSVHAEFNSFEACETARKAMASAHHANRAVLRAQGCFKKG